MAGKAGRLVRLVKKLRQTGPAYASCWGCAMGQCNAMFDKTCACCRAKHTGVR